jgi:hypothetical protein
MEQTDNDELPMVNGNQCSMNRVSQSAAASTQKPVPPAGGWSLMDAADILCPLAAVTYREGGNALEAAVGNELHRLSARAIRHPELRPDAWLTLQLLDALCQRPDLQLTGRNLHDAMAPRSPIQPDILQAACGRDNRADAIFRRWVLLSFREDQAGTGHDVPPTHLNTTSPSHLMDVRVEMSGTMLQPHLPVDGTEATGKPKYTFERAQEWLRWRVQDWPEGKPPPTATECLREARAHFSGHIPLHKFYVLRKPVVPRDWQKQGHRGPQN